MNKRDQETILDCLQIRINFLRQHIKKSNHKIICMKFDNKESPLSFYNQNQIHTWEHGIENAEKKIKEIQDLMDRL